MFESVKDVLIDDFNLECNYEADLIEKICLLAGGSWSAQTLAIELTKTTARKCQILYELGVSEDEARRMAIEASKDS